ncbi:hypothetical protein BRD19_06935 [Halobacteriales archaeon SW_7_65_23]|nr:MAG: hypothetical protein BRD19_06935 [Halobacteriales archaeon SW_7_65_23]
MTGFFLPPATDRKGALEHLRKTVLEGVPRDMYSNFIDEDLGSCAHVWGLTSSIKSTWENADRDDWVLFYTQENQYEYAARIKGKQHNPDYGNRFPVRFIRVTNDRLEAIESGYDSVDGFVTTIREDA